MLAQLIPTVMKNTTPTPANTIVIDSITARNKSFSVKNAPTNKGITERIHIQVPSTLYFREYPDIRAVKNQFDLR